MQTQGIIPLILPLHILGGTLALVFGYAALYATKGATVHRTSGMFFVFAMVAMSLSGALIATLNGSSVSVIAGLLTGYFVTTALLTVRKRAAISHAIDIAAMLFALTVAMLAFKTGADLSATGRPEAAPMFIFGAMGLLAAIGDLRMIRADGIQGSRRIARHLWRMCFAMWVAAGSFFWGPPGRVPEVLNDPVIKAVGALTPIVMMLYWLWRIRVRQTLRGIVQASAPVATALERI